MYIEVVLPVPIGGTFTYFVPPEMEAQIVIGGLVQVSFGKTQQHSGIVFAIRESPPAHIGTIKPVLAIESDRPVIRREQGHFWEWIANYYLCSLGEVAKAVLPAGFRSKGEAVFREKKETFVRIASRYEEEAQLLNVLNGMKRAVRQEELLSAFVRETQTEENVFREISKKELLEKSGAAQGTFAALVEKGIFQLYEKAVAHPVTSDTDLQPLHRLNAGQQQALNEIIEIFRQKDVCLLHGVTSSGKTEIYTHLIHQTLQSNKQVLYLLPEIALTVQITERLKKFFGDQLGVYHSGINPRERMEIWNNLLHDEGYQIILGVRSSVFLPFRDLGLIIVDEEHDPSYKQQDPAPRYHARNAAAVLATLHDAKVVLGSATPSIESFYNARIGKYGYVRLDKRFEETELPLILPVDVKELRRKKQMKTIFSPLLLEQIQECIEKGEQILLFQNRRGFAPHLVCRICDWTPKCRFCDISLTYHKKLNQLSCHYCGRSYRLPTQCPDCEQSDLKPAGFGTEKVEEDIQRLFPYVSVDRMDMDTTRTKQSFREIMARFEEKQTQILVGTQMISKGLDFENIGLVGILNADALMNYPDFRAYERAYQLMSQVAGRAGRRKKQGKVILQTSHPDHPLIETILRQNYEAMYEQQMEERELFRYPPLFRLIQIMLRHKKEECLRNAANEYARMLREKLGDRVIGPDKPAVGKVQNYYLQKIVLKIELLASLSALREILEHARTQLLDCADFRYVSIQFDVDPV
ncbi:MAG: primosomal protein N' [Candidatus Azobacteroides sp.]|nr:primosomal protein N' [Candidatus Azobacteroides sp.]